MKEKLPIIGIIIILILSIMSASATASDPVVALPPTELLVTMRATDGVNSWFDIELSDIPSGYDITNGIYLGWCAQKSIKMTRGVNHTVRLYSSYDPDMPESFRSENWSKINYLLNHKQGSRASIQETIWYYISLDTYPSDPDAQSMISNADQNGLNFIPKNGEVLAIIVEGVKTIQRTFFEYVIPTPPLINPKEPPSEPNPGVTGGVSVQNHAPTADATAGEPYKGFARGEITFDGSRSYDRDGRIVTWNWDFGDETVGSGKIVTHTYTAPGNYTVVLTVKDDKRATDSYTTKAVITQGNNPPKTPTVSGPQTGYKNTSYEFTTVSTDPDNDSLKYIINWGDGEITTTAYSSSGIPIVQTHEWSEPGHYTITVKASDNNIESGTATVIILVDVFDVKGLGYLIENDNDGTYDAFYSNSTGMKTKVEKLSNGNYLIDSNGDGTWDYEYNPASGETSIYQEQQMAEYLVVAILLIACLTLYIILEMRRKRSKRNKT
jgi:hypothetical protein